MDELLNNRYQSEYTRELTGKIELLKKEIDEINSQRDELTKSKNEKMELLRKYIDKLSMDDQHNESLIKYKNEKISSLDEEIATYIDVANKLQTNDIYDFLCVNELKNSLVEFNDRERILKNMKNAFPEKISDYIEDVLKLSFYHIDNIKRIYNLNQIECPGWYDRKYSNIFDEHKFKMINMINSKIKKLIEEKNRLRIHETTDEIEAIDEIEDIDDSIDHEAIDEIDR